MNLENANAKQKNVFDFAMKNNLESEAYSEHRQTSTMELFCENSWRLINR